jgi:hypothetical protein
MPSLSAIHSTITITGLSRTSARPQSASDPAILAIENYWKALESWRVADRRLKRLQKRLPADVMRLPRVQVSYYLRGRDDKTGNDIKESIYVHSEWAIKDHIRKECKTMLSIWAGPTWVYDPKAKNGLRKSAAERAKKERPIIRTKYKNHEKIKIAEFVADRDALYARQRACGWRQAVEAEEVLRTRVANLRYRAQDIKPTTVAGAIALIEFIHLAYHTRMNSNNEGAPYGLGEYYPAHIARNVARFLRPNSRLRHAA